MSLEPLLGVDLVRAQNGADLVVEDLRGGAGQRRQPRLFQSAQVVDERLAEAPGAFGHLERGEAVDVDALRCLADGPDHLEVVVAVEARVDAALEAHLGGAGGFGLGHSLGDVAQLEQVGRTAQVERKRALGERAEPALEGAHVGVVDVAVGHPRDHVTDLLAPQLIGQLGHRPHVGPRAENSVTISSSPTSWPSPTPASTSTRRHPPARGPGARHRGLRLRPRRRL